MAYNNPVLSATNNNICTLTLNRPECLNALNESLLTGLKEAISIANSNPDINVIVLKGAGRAFCAGKDLKEHKELGANREAARRAIELLHDINREILFSDKIVLAGVHGWAVGGGLEIMIACDLVILSDNTRMFFPEMSIGLFVTGGITTLLPHMIGFSRAKAMILTGEQLNAQEAKSYGLASKVVSHKDFETELISFAQQISELPQASQRKLKKVMNTALREQVERAFEMEKQAAEESVTDSESLELIRRKLS